MIGKITVIKSSNPKNHIIEPNLIPLLDFMLVLVIMFTLIAGPIKQIMQVPLPQVNGSSATNSQPNEVLMVKAKNDIYFKQQQFNDLDALEKALKKAITPNMEINLALDKQLDVETLLKLFAITKNLGIKTANIEIDTEAN